LKEKNPWGSDMKESSDIHWHGRRIEGIVFDLDGTLSDSIEAHYEVFRETTVRFGIQVNREDVLETMATGSLIWDRAIPQDIPDRDQKVKKCMELIPQVFQKVMRCVRAFVGVETVLKTLRERDIKVGLATSSWLAAIQPLKNQSLIPYFDAILTHEDGLPRKPSPAIILECLRRLDVHPDHALTVGDSPLDIRAGKRGGLLTIGVLCGVGSRSQLEAEKPTALIEQVAQIPDVLGLK